jgi:hypothetical protein
LNDERLVPAWNCPVHGPLAAGGPPPGQDGEFYTCPICKLPLDLPYVDKVLFRHRHGKFHCPGCNAKGSAAMGPMGEFNATCPECGCKLGVTWKPETNH